MDDELSEEQRSALEERRQRSEKISRLMGPYLLKRYRMLSETCNVCKVRAYTLIKLMRAPGHDGFCFRTFCCSLLKELNIV